MGILWVRLLNLAFPGEEKMVKRTKGSTALPRIFVWGGDPGCTPNTSSQGPQGEPCTLGGSSPEGRCGHLVAGLQPQMFPHWLQLQEMPAPETWVFPSGLSGPCLPQPLPWIKDFIKSGKRQPHRSAVSEPETGEDG